MSDVFRYSRSYYNLPLLHFVVVGSNCRLVRLRQLVSNYSCLHLMERQQMQNVPLEHLHQMNWDIMLRMFIRNMN